MIPVEQIETLALGYLWPFLRLSAMLMVAPVFGAGTVSVRIRVVLAALLSALMAPMLPINPDIAFFSAPGILMALREISIGLAMGFVMQMIFGAVVLAGQSIATGMGLGFAMSVDPQNGVQVPIVSHVKVVIATLLFLAIDGHLMLISAVFQSFALVPLTDPGFAATGYENLVALGSQLFASALLLGLLTLTRTDDQCGVWCDHPRCAPAQYFCRGIPGHHCGGYGVSVPRYAGLHRCDAAIL